MLDKETLELEETVRNRFICMAHLRQQHANNIQLNQYVTESHNQWIKGINNYNQQISVIVLGLDIYLRQYRKEAIDLHVSLFTRALKECTVCFGKLSNLIESLSTRSNVRTETIAMLTDLNITVSDIKDQVNSLAQHKDIRNTQYFVEEYQLQCKTIIDTIQSATRKLQELAMDGIRRYAITADVESSDSQYLTTSEDDILDGSYL